MAKANNGIPPKKRKKSRASRSAMGRWASDVFGNVFCKRTVIIIADHKTQHIPFSAMTQVAGVFGALCVVVWASYSSGSYAAAQRILEEKERKLASTALENKRVSAEFSLLKTDLMKLATGVKSGKPGDYAKMLAEQYTNKPPGDAPPAPVTDQVVGNDVSEEVRAQYASVIQRVEFLDNKVQELQATHDEMMADIRATTGGKIKEIEKIIARTGMDAKPLEKMAEAKRAQEDQRREKYARAEKAGNDEKTSKSVADSAERADADSDDATLGDGQGGPYEPMRESSLKTRETELYFNLRRLMTLNDVVESLPLDAPLAVKNYRQTSGFGTRVDPFRGSLSFHSGLDFAGPEHAKVIATNDGRVAFAGWQSAYGNMVDIKHNYGISTRYAHLERVLVQPEQLVKKGQVIGIQGSTGRSTGHHLHYEVRYQGKAINPSNFVKAGADVRASK